MACPSAAFPGRLALQAFPYRTVVLENNNPAGTTQPGQLNPHFIYPAPNPQLISQCFGLTFRTRRAIRTSSSKEYT